MMQIRSIKGDNYKAYNKNSKIQLLYYMCAEIIGTLLGVAFTQIGNNSVYLHRLHFLASFLYMSWI